MAGVGFARCTRSVVLCNTYSCELRIQCACNPLRSVISYFRNWVCIITDGDSGFSNAKPMYWEFFKYLKVEHLKAVPLDEAEAQDWLSAKDRITDAVATHGSGADCRARVSVRYCRREIRSAQRSAQTEREAHGSRTANGQPDARQSSGEIADTMNDRPCEPNCDPIEDRTRRRTVAFLRSTLV